MPDERTAGVGAELREARERAGLSVRDISTNTKIPVNTLEAIERDDVSRLPGGIFLRSFVRAYAGEVGLDPEETVRRFVARFPDASVEEPPAQYVANPERIVVDDQPAAGRLWRIAGWSLPFILVIVYFGFGGRLAWWRQPAQTVAPRASEAAAEPSASSSAPVLTTPIGAEPSADAAAAPPEGTDAGAAATQPGPAAAAGGEGAAAPLAEGQFQLTLSARGRCWVTVRSDGKIVYTGTLQPGDRQDLTLGGSVSLTVGDAGAIDVLLNGRPARSLGGNGQVATARLTAATLDSFLASR